VIGVARWKRRIEVMQSFEQKIAARRSEGAAAPPRAATARTSRVCARCAPLSTTRAAPMARKRYDWIGALASVCTPKRAQSVLAELAPMAGSARSDCARVQLVRAPAAQVASPGVPTAGVRRADRSGARIFTVLVPDLESPAQDRRGADLPHSVRRLGRSRRRATARRDPRAASGGRSARARGAVPPRRRWRAPARASFYRVGGSACGRGVRPRQRASRRGRSAARLAGPGAGELCRCHRRPGFDLRGSRRGGRERRPAEVRAPPLLGYTYRARGFPRPSLVAGRPRTVS
jgi:hypothetical protein